MNIKNIYYNIGVKSKKAENKIKIPNNLTKIMKNKFTGITN